MDKTIQDLLILCMEYGGEPDYAVIQWLKDTHGINFNPDNYHWRPVNEPVQNAYTERIKEIYESQLISQLEAESLFLRMWANG